MKNTGNHLGHMWLVGGGVAAVLLFGLGAGWALALALLACSAMLGTVFWIGRSSARQVSPGPSRERIDMDSQP